MITSGKLGPALAVLWLLAASSLVFVLAQHLAAASAFQGAGQYAETVIGQPDFVSTANNATASSLYHPFRLTFDSQGDLWIADEYNDRVLEFKAPFTDGMSASMVVGQTNFTSNAPHITQWGTSQDAGVSFDSHGDLWVADWSNNRILEFSPPFSPGMNATLELGQQPGPQEFTANNATARPRGVFVNPHYSNQLQSPGAMAFDSAGNLWVSDRANDRVVEFKPPFSSGMNASSVIGQSNVTSFAFASPPSAKSLFGAQDVAFDSRGNLWVVDEDDNRVLEFAASSLAADDPSAVLELGQPAGPSQFSNNTANDTPSGFEHPTGVAFDGQGNLWVVDRGNNRVMEFRAPFTDGESASLVIGQPAGPTSMTTNVAAGGETGLNNPLSAAIDPEGDLWVSDQANDRVLEFSSQALETAGTSVSLANATTASAVNSTAQATCNTVGTLAICHLTVSQAQPEVAIDATGTLASSNANLYSSYLGTQEPGGEGPPPFASASYYGEYLTGITNGTAKFCLTTSTSAAGMQYHAGGQWSSADTTRDGSSACAVLPLAIFSQGQVILAVQAAQGAQSGAGLGAIAALKGAEEVGLVGAAVVVAVLVVRKRRQVKDVPEDDEEGLDDWV